jgi:hypothetical protein
MKKLVLSLVFALVATFAFAQDTIVKKNGEKIACKVVEIGTTEITYKKASNPDGPVYAIKKSDVWKIIFENGTVELITSEALSVTPANRELRMRKRAITTRPMSPLWGFVSIGYQQALTPTRAMVFDVGLIGPGFHAWQNLTQQGYPKGFYLKAGFRLKRTPEVVMEGQEWGYNLAGFYVEPEVAFSSFNQQRTIYNSQTGQGTTSTYHYYSGAFMIAAGRQMIVGDIFTFDLSAAIGYASSDNDEPKNTSPGYFEFEGPRNFYSHHAGGGNLPVAWKFNFTMGVLLK